MIILPYGSQLFQIKELDVSGGESKRSLRLLPLSMENTFIIIEYHSQCFILGIIVSLKENFSFEQQCCNDKFESNTSHYNETWARSRGTSAASAYSIPLYWPYYSNRLLYGIFSIFYNG